MGDKVKLWDRDRMVKVVHHNGETWVHPAAIGAVTHSAGVITVFSTTGAHLANTSMMSLEYLDAEINRSMDAIVEAESSLRKEMGKNIQEALEKVLADANDAEDLSLLGGLDKIGKDVN